MAVREAKPNGFVGGMKIQIAFVRASEGSPALFHLEARDSSISGRWRSAVIANQHAGMDGRSEECEVLLRGNKPRVFRFSTLIDAQTPIFQCADAQG